MLNLAEYRSEDHRPVPTTCRGPAWWRPASCSTRTARSSARCAIAAPTSTAPPRPSWSRSRARLNNVLKRFGAGWALFFEAERVPANQLSAARALPTPPSWLVDQERHAAFSADGAHHESRYYLTFLYLPPPEHEGRAERLLYERTETTAIEADAARPARVRS